MKPNNRDITIQGINNVNFGDIEDMERATDYDFNTIFNILVELKRHIRNFDMPSKKFNCFSPQRDIDNTVKYAIESSKKECKK